MALPQGVHVAHEVPQKRTVLDGSLPVRTRMCTSLSRSEIICQPRASNVIRRLRISASMRRPVAGVLLQNVLDFDGVLPRGIVWLCEQKTGHALALQR